MLRLERGIQHASAAVGLRRYRINRTAALDTSLRLVGVVDLACAFRLFGWQHFFRNIDAHQQRQSPCSHIVRTQRRLSDSHTYLRIALTSKQFSDEASVRLRRRDKEVL